MSVGKGNEDLAEMLQVAVQNQVSTTRSPGALTVLAAPQLIVGPGGVANLTDEPGVAALEFGSPNSTPVLATPAALAEASAPVSKSSELQRLLLRKELPQNRWMVQFSRG